MVTEQPALERGRGAAPNDAGLGPKPFPSAPPGFVVGAALRVHRALRGLVDRILPAEVVAFEHTTGAMTAMLVGAIARHRIPDLLAEQPMTAAELAARAGLDADALHRVLRALVWKKVLALGRDGRFRNTRVSRALYADHVARTRAFAEYVASGSNMRAYIDIDHALATGKNAFAHANGAGVWDWFDAHPDERECFAQAMMGLTTHDAPVVARLYPWREVTRVCDVGGGRGTLLSELLVRHPHLRGTLCDGAGVIASARGLLEARGVADRVTLAPGSFFDTIPGGAEAYVLKNILHDWDDERSIRILRAVRRAMAPGARLVVVDALLERDQVSVMAIADVQMLAVCDEGRERSLSDFHRLFDAAGLAPGRVFRYPTVSVIEARAAS